MTRKEVYDQMVAMTGVREVLTMDEILEHVSGSKTRLYNRLKELKELGDVDSEKVGAGAKVWWPVGENVGTVPDINEDSFSERERKVIRTAKHAASTGEPVTSSLVEDHTGLDSDKAYKVLRSLQQQGLLETKKVGATARVYWLDRTP